MKPYRTEEIERPFMGVKDMPVDDQPREKMQRFGAEFLSDAELLAIILRSGTKYSNVIDLSRTIINRFGNLGNLGRVSWKELSEIHGLGVVKSLIVEASMEIGRRMQRLSEAEGAKVSTSKGIYEYFKPMIADLHTETFIVAFLKRNGNLSGYTKISSGGRHATVVDIAEVFRHALINKASSIVVVHNHPSGGLAPSRADRQLTDKLCEAGKNIQMDVTDHIIISTQGYYSFADNGLIKD